MRSQKDKVRPTSPCNHGLVILLCLVKKETQDKDGVEVAGEAAKACWSKCGLVAVLKGEAMQDAGRLALWSYSKLRGH